MLLLVLETEPRTSLQETLSLPFSTEAQSSQTLIPFPIFETWVLYKIKYMVTKINLSARNQNLLYHVIFGIRPMIFIQSIGENVDTQRSHVARRKLVPDLAKGTFLLW